MIDMKAFVHRDYGRIVGAYWAPENSGFSYPQTAEAFLSVDGRGLVFGWRDVTRLDRHANGGRGALVVIGREHTGNLQPSVDGAAMIDQTIRKALQDALDAAILASKPTHIPPTGDDWGNIE